VLLFQLDFQIGNVVLEVSLFELSIQFLLITTQEQELHLLFDVARKQFGVVSAQPLKNLVERNELEPDLPLSGDVPPAATRLLHGSLHPSLGVNVELLDDPESSLSLAETVLGSGLVRFGARLQVAALVLSFLVRAFQVVQRVQFGRVFFRGPSERFGLRQHLVYADPNSSFSQFLYKLGVHFDSHRLGIPAQSPGHDTLDQSRAVGAEALDLLEKEHLLLVLKRGRLAMTVVVRREGVRTTRLGMLRKRVRETKSRQQLLLGQGPTRDNLLGIRLRRNGGDVLGGALREVARNGGHRGVRKGPFESRERSHLVSVERIR